MIDEQLMEAVFLFIAPEKTSAEIAAHNEKLMESLRNE